MTQAFLELRRAGRFNYQLVILGLKHLEPLGLTLEERTQALHWIHLPGFVPDSDLPGYYQHATAFLFPSLYEGFGIPLLEAMACGTPVITSNETSLPEIAGDAALLIDPRNVEELKGGILRLVASPDLQWLLSASGKTRIQAFSWVLAADKTFECYEKSLHT